MFADLGFAPEASESQGRPQILLHPCRFREAVDANQEVVCSVHLGLLRRALGELGAPLDATDLKPFVEPSLCVADLGERGDDPRRDMVATCKPRPSRPAARIGMAPGPSHRRPAGRTGRCRFWLPASEELARWTSQAAMWAHRRRRFETVCGRVGPGSQVYASAARMPRQTRRPAVDRWRSPPASQVPPGVRPRAG